jgi:leucyl-tRNA synthetase
MQRNWIGKSKGANVTFTLPSVQEEVSVFTTRPDTLYGVTYMVLAPEHPLVSKLIAGNPQEQEIVDFIQKMRKSTELERTATDVEKVGYDTGAKAIHPLTGEEIPIWIANYVLFDYGTGAVMGVPAHDERDFVFAKKYDLPIKVVVQPEGEKLVEPLAEAFTGTGKLVASDVFNGIENQAAITAIADHLEQQNKGGSVTNYRLRDWLISRQRYWGTPIPVIYCNDCGTVPVPKEQLPVVLPEDVVFDGKSNPLTTSESFVHTTCPSCGGDARRETDTMDTFIDSSWYYIRYVDADNQEIPFAKDKADDWLPVNEYIGGIEHAVLHLLYSRFFTKVLYDAGMVSVEEPFESLLAQGMVLRDGSKMSKSKGNVVSPLEIIEKYGADTARLFILFAAPPERDLEWSAKGVEGSYRFIKRVWRLVHENRALFAQKSSSAELSAAAKELRRLTHQTIQKVTVEIGERNHFNTAVSAVMELVNGISTYPANENRFVLRDALQNVVLLLAPFVPHLAEELWEVMGNKGTVHLAAWPSYDPSALVQDEVEIMVQINGKNKERLVVASQASREEIEAIAIANEKIQSLIADKTVRKVIVVPKKLVNVVVG